MRNSTLLNISLITFLFLMTSCSISKTKLSRDAEEMDQFIESVPTHCTEIKKVRGVNEGSRVDLARIHAMNLAADIGGDGITFDKEVMSDGHWSVYATAYKCRKDS